MFHEPIDHRAHHRHLHPMRLQLSIASGIAHGVVHELVVGVRNNVNRHIGIVRGRESRLERRRWLPSLRRRHARVEISGVVPQGARAALVRIASGRYTIPAYHNYATCMRGTQVCRDVRALPASGSERSFMKRFQNLTKAFLCSPLLALASVLIVQSTSARPDTVTRLPKARTSRDSAAWNDGSPLPWSFVGIRVH